MPLKRINRMLVVVFGDTDSTLAAAMAASRAQVPVVHIEAGLRSFDRRMPEEHNRILTDQLSDVLFCPSESSIKQLASEGIFHGQSPMDCWFKQWAI